MKDFDYEQMLAGELYRYQGINDEHQSIHGKKIAQQINHLPIEQSEKIVELEKKLFKKTGENLYVTPPLHVDYGCHVTVGEWFYANMDCVFLDVNEIIIGDDVMLGPRVNLLTAGHPTDPDIRREGLEFGEKIIIGNNVWIGGNATVLPGITIGDNSIIGAGSVVTKDIPANVIAVGNPAKVARQIDETDRQKWQTAKEKYLNAKNK